MTIYTMGFAQKNAKTFFELIKENKIEVLIDIRLNNKSQLAGFTKGSDLEYFLPELCDCKYCHEVDFAPTKEILDSYKSNKITWSDYEKAFFPLMKNRNIKAIFNNKYKKYSNICLLCSEPKPDMCHRRLVAEIIKDKNDDIIHL